MSTSAGMIAASRDRLGPWWVTWVAALATLVLGMLALGATPAGADSIAYVGGDGNVWVSTPDGTRKAQVTSDAGSPLSNGRTKSYAGPGQTDDGTIVVPANDRWFYVLSPDGSTEAGPWLSPTNATSTSPIGIDIAPGGGLIAYWHLYAASLNSAPTPQVAFANSNSFTTKQCLLAPCHKPFTTPRWVPGRNVVAMINSAGNRLAVQTGGGEEQTWLELTGGTIDNFDISRSGYRTLIAAHDTVNGDRELLVWDNQVAPPDASQGRLVCGLDDFSQGPADPRWSPDGSSFTWSDDRGVWVSPAPVATAGGSCAIQPRLIAAGGELPDWSAATVPAAPPAGGGSPPATAPSPVTSPSPASIPPPTGTNSPSPGTTASHDGSADPGAGAACERAKRSATKAKKALKRSKRAVRKAETQRASQKAEKKLKKAKKKLKKAKRRKRRACA